MRKACASRPQLTCTLCEMMNTVDAVEQWACDSFRIVELDSVGWTYSGDGPPSWRKRRPEIERALEPTNPADWWHLLCLADLRSVLTSDARVLDLGCGPGWPAIPLSFHVAQITAVDASDLAVALITDAIRARDVGNIHVKKGDAADLRFEDGAFDAVIASDLMDVVSSPTSVAREVFRVLRPGGRFVSWVQNFRHILGRKEQRQRCFQIKGNEATYTYHYASLSPAHSLDLRFHLAVQSAPVAVTSIVEGKLNVDENTVIEELQALRPAIGPEVQVYRAPEFIPETAHEPFAAAGFMDLTVLPLNCDACTAFVDELIRSRRLPRDTEEFHALAAALLRVMQCTEPDESWEVSVKGTKPECSEHTASSSNRRGKPRG